MSLELSREMLAVKGYLGDARVLVEEQVGRSGNLGELGLIIEVARMLQVERQHHSHKKSKPEEVTPTAPAKRVTSDSIMTRVRSHPNLPPMVSAEPEETPVKRSRPSKSRRAPIVKEVQPSRPRKADPKRVTPKKTTRRR